MKNRFDIVYLNNQTLGYIDDKKYKSYNKDERQEVLDNLKKEIIKKENNRKIASLIIGLCMLSIAVVIAILMLFDVITLGSGEWFNYTFLIVGLVILWVLFYYAFGFIFYDKINVNIFFKNPKLSDSNVCVTYASSNYFKWVSKHMNDLTNANFVVKSKKKRKDILVGFGLRMPSSFKNLIFNGHINSNIPYYYLAIKDEKLIFLPGIVIYINGSKSDAFLSKNLKVTCEDKKYQLYNEEKYLTSFTCDGEFDINFFYFRYEQI